MIYHYHMSYDEHKDEFFAYVDDGSKRGKTLFTIDSVEEVCSYIQTGRMEHIDDTDGLEDFLKEQGILEDDDVIMLCEEMVW